MDVAAGKVDKADEGSETVGQVVGFMKLLGNIGRGSRGSIWFRERGWIRVRVKGLGRFKIVH